LAAAVIAVMLASMPIMAMTRLLKSFLGIECTWDLMEY